MTCRLIAIKAKSQIHDNARLQYKTVQDKRLTLDSTFTCVGGRGGGGEIKLTEPRREMETLVSSILSHKNVVRKNCKFKLIVKSINSYLHLRHQNKDSSHTDDQLSIAVDRSTTNAPVNRSGKKLL